MRAKVRSVLAGVPTWAWAVTLSTLFGVIYLVTGPVGVDDAFRPLAKAFLAGRLAVPNGSNGELIPGPDGFSYVPYPPVPALPFIPVELLHLPLTNPMLTALAGGIAVLLAYGLLRGLQTRPSTSLIGSAASAVPRSDRRCSGWREPVGPGSTPRCWRRRFCSAH